MPPQTEEGLAADKALDDKLGAFYASETADSGPDTGTPAEVEAPEAPVETPETPDAPVTPPSEAAPDDPEVAAVLQKYGGDPNKALRALVDAQSLIGRQGQELGDLRREFETQIAAVQAQQQQNQYAQQAPSAINAALEQGNYYAAAEAARQVNDPMLYQQVMTAWTADPDQTFGALAYHSALAAQDAEARVLAAMDQRYGALNDATQPLLQQNAQDNFQREFLSFGRGKNDFEQVAPAMLQVAQENSALINTLLSSDNPNERQQGYNYLYREARDRVGDTLAQAADQVATEQQQAARDAKTQATVGSASSQSQAKPQTNLEKAKEEFRAILFDDSTSIQRGLVRGQ